jgi:hypothetical protein
MRHGRPIALLLIVAVAVLSALAHASPPDPTWIAGVWDGADYDDVVLIATSADAVDDGVRLDEGRPLWVVLGTVETCCSPSLHSSSAPALVRGRAPPGA